MKIRTDLRFSLFVHLALVGIWMLNARAAEPFHLTQNGKAVVDIVYQDEPSDYPIPAAQQRERFAETLADFVRIVREISGAELKVYSVAEAGERGVANTIQIGATPAAREAGLVEKVGALKPHALLMQSDASKQVLYLVGSTLEGSGHAMYAFLESLGCRWYYPGAEGEELPTLPSIALGSDETSIEPEFEFRSMQLTNTSQFGRKDTQTRAEWVDWMRRNKFGGWAPPRGHAFPKLVGNRFAEKPELYSLRNGKRVASHLCLTNPEVMEAAVANLTEQFTKNPELRGFPVALADGAQYCECPACTEACGGDPKDIMKLYLDFNRELFDRIDQLFPGREFQYGFYVYSNLMAPPAGEVPKQLAPYFAPLGYDPFQTFLEPESYQLLSVWNDFPPATREKILTREPNYLLEKVRAAIQGWGQGTSNMYLRDYDPYITFQQNLPVFRPYQLAVEIPWYKEVGVRGFTPEICGLSWFAAGLNHWVRSRLYWNAGLDIKEELTEMCKGMFGPAWQPMYGYFDALSRRTIETDAFRHGDEVLPRLYSIEFVKELEPYLRRAEELAESPKHQARVRMWSLSQQYMLRYLMARNAELRGNFVDASALTQEFLRLNDAVEGVNPHYIDHRWYDQRTFSMFSMLDSYQRLADRQNGVKGRMLTQLPLSWHLRYDPKGVGMDEAWFQFEATPAYVNNADGAIDGTAAAIPEWRLAAPSDSWQRLESDYEGFNWFRNELFVPESAGDQRVRMVVTGIFGHMDFFINGKRLTWKGARFDAEAQEWVDTEIRHLDLGSAWSWNYNREFDVDVTDLLVPGAVNTFAFRSKDMWKWGGIFKTVFLYTPNEATEVAAYLPHTYTDRGDTNLNTLKSRPACDCMDGHQL